MREIMMEVADQEEQRLAAADEQRTAERTSRRRHLRVGLVGVGGYRCTLSLKARVMNVWAGQPTRFQVGGLNRLSFFEWVPQLGVLVTASKRGPPVLVYSIIRCKHTQRLYFKANCRVMDYHRHVDPATISGNGGNGGDTTGSEMAIRFGQRTLLLRRERPTREQDGEGAEGSPHRGRGAALLGRLLGLTAN
ncbi:unnamed protein product [Vitrella brassicaformis CCMP3155]|uniref:Uncharacterized protein n=1 Tax=Vitrella brassicaformis (strain CCMP3155) TaxID=1169540 RepID=A0A0G4G630_VITBC|nr:unnamed protein product [Vitrella brassicaformis CCMP3155]|eukprot:CEM23864.1 unnamed protein product [Vitrella brassicaformis CCMP3155]